MLGFTPEQALGFDNDMYVLAYEGHRKSQLSKRMLALSLVDLLARKSAGERITEERIREILNG